MTKRFFEKAKIFVFSKKTRGVLILSFLMTCFSYFLTPLFRTGPYTNDPVVLFDSRYHSLFHGFPWSYYSTYLYKPYFTLFYFILDLFVWFLVIKLLLIGICLIKDSLTPNK